MANSHMTFGVDLLPKTTNTYNLGNSNQKWNIYLNNLNNIDFGSVTSAATFRTAIGAGTSSLTLGTTSSTALAGNTTVTNVNIAANTTTNADYPVVFAKSNTSTTAEKNEGLQKNGISLFFNPSTGTLTTSKLVTSDLTISKNIGFQKITFDMGAGPIAVGWRRVCKVAQLNYYHQWFLGINGEYTSVAPTGALIAISSLHTSINAMLLSCQKLPQSRLSKIRFLKNDQCANNEYWLDIYCDAFTGTGTWGKIWFYLWGNVKVTDIQTDLSVNTETSEVGAEVELREIKDQPTITLQDYNETYSSTATITHNDQTITLPQSAYFKSIYSIDSTNNPYAMINGTGDNLWIGAGWSTTNHHKGPSGKTYISSGYSTTENKGNDTIYISIPSLNDTTWSHSIKAVAHSGNVETGTNNGQIKIAGTDVSVKGLATAAYREVYTLIAAGDAGWDTTTNRTKVPDMNFMAYWDGTYNGTSSNLRYYNGGAFGTMAKESAADYLTLSGGTMTGQIKLGTSTITSAPTDSGIYVHDTRDVSHLPNTWGDQTVQWYFDTGATDTGRADWSTIMHLKGWTQNYAAHQLSFNASNNINDVNLYHRVGRDQTWESWKKILDSSNYTDYAVKIDGSNATGPWGISITGNAQTSTDASYLQGIYSYDSNMNAAVATNPTDGKVQYFYTVNKSAAGIFPNTSNANGLLTFNTYSRNNVSNYSHQLGFSSNGNLYHRAFHNANIDATTSWNKILTTKDKYLVMGSNDITAIVPSLSSNSPELTNISEAGVYNIGTATNMSKLKNAPFTGSGARIFVFNGHTGNLNYGTELAIGSILNYMYFRRANQSGAWTNPWYQLVYADPSARGNSTTPVYVDSTGKLTPCTGILSSVMRNPWVKGTQYTTEKGNFICFYEQGTGTAIKNRLAGIYNFQGQNSLSNRFGLIAYESKVDSEKSAFFYVACNSSSATEPERRTYTNAQIYGAVWNDYAEYRQAQDEVRPGNVVVDTDWGSLRLSSERLQPGAQVVSDTFGFAIGETENCKTPLAVSGRVLAYTYQPRENYHAGMAVCSAPNGTIDIMTREEIQMYPDAIVGIVSEIPEYEEWGTGNVKVNGRIWIKVR